MIFDGCCKIVEEQLEVEEKTQRGSGPCQCLGTSARARRALSLPDSWTLRLSPTLVPLNRNETDQIARAKLL